MNDDPTPARMVALIIEGARRSIPNLRTVDLALDMAIPLGAAVPEGEDAPTLLRQALVASGRARDHVAAIAMAARMRALMDEVEQSWTNASVMPAMTEAEKDECLAEMQRDEDRLTSRERAEGDARFALRTDWAHLACGPAAIAHAQPQSHASILAHLLGLADDEDTLLRIGADWLCGAAGDGGDGRGGGGDDDGPPPEPGPRPPSNGRRIRNRENA